MIGFGLPFLKNLQVSNNSLSFLHLQGAGAAAAITGSAFNLSKLGTQGREKPCCFDPFIPILIYLSIGRLCFRMLLDRYEHYLFHWGADISSLIFSWCHE